MDQESEAKASSMLSPAASSISAPPAAASTAATTSSTVSPTTASSTETSATASSSATRTATLATSATAASSASSASSATSATSDAAPGGKRRPRRFLGRKKGGAGDGKGPRKPRVRANQIPDSVLLDAELQRDAQHLPSNYNFEIFKSVWRVRQAGATCVALQFPEGLLLYSCVISDIIEKVRGAR